MKVFERYPLEELAKYIDWTPFFLTWELAGKYPNILDDKVVGEEATKLFRDAKEMLRRFIDENLIQANGVIGFWPANQVDGDDIEIVTEVNGQQARDRLYYLRQQTPRPAGKPNLCLADYIAPKSTGKVDYIGGFAVTAGIGVDKLVAEYESEHDDYNAIMVKAIADRLAEAFAERMHERVRKEYWAYTAEDKLSNEELIKERYAGIRPAPGYPACPDHRQKETLFSLLSAENNTHMTLTEHYAMSPAASVSGWYFSHPESRYFAVGKINKDQVEIFAKRSEQSVETTERWLSPNLSYDA